MADHYDLLGVPSTASVDEIKAAYKKLAKQVHPDVNAAPDAGERFRALTAAYDTLTDGSKRAAYDAVVASSRFPGVPGIGGVSGVAGRAIDRAHMAEFSRLRGLANQAERVQSRTKLLLLLSVPALFLVRRQPPFCCC